MSIETAIIARARPFILASRVQALIRDEIRKGCSPALAALPVQLEPRFHPVHDLVRQAGPLPDPVVPEPAFQWPCWTRLRVWISPNQPFDWNRSELFLKQLAGASHRLGFEIAGNQARIDLTVLVHRDDLPTVETAFDGEFDRCELMPAREAVMDRLGSQSWPEARFEDFYPPPPYFHLLSTFEELMTSPFETFLCALHELQGPAVGFYQCLFQPVQSGHNWHANVEQLQDLEYGIKLQSGLGTQFVQQLPSGDLRGMAHDLERKAHNDKPFFAAAVRIGVVGEGGDATRRLRALCTCMSLFQHGGRPLCHLGRPEYHQEPALIADMIHKGRTYRPGFLVNSRELAGLVHVFSANILEHRELKLETLETLPVRNPDLNEGTVIGISRYGESIEDVCIPHGLRACGTHILGSSGAGKSTVMINMFIQDVEAGRGAVFIDAHGDAVKTLLGLIPEKDISRCIYFDPGDPHWIPSWNPLYVPPGGDVYRMTTDFLSAFERISRDWGDRLACVLRNGLIGLSYLKEAALNDLLNLVRQKSPQSEALRKQIIALATDENVRHFWEWDFLKDYRADALASPKHKLSPLISGCESARLMVSQPGSAIQLREIMDHDGILLVNLSGVGSQTREVLGSLILSLFTMATVNRSDLEADQRRPFSIYADEAHLFVSADAIENLIAQARKFCVNLCIAHQYRTQFKSEQVDALSIVGSAIFGRLDKRDSQYFSKDLQDLVDPTELIRLKPREMIARIGTDIVRVHTVRCKRSPNADVRAQIMERSHRQYCLPAEAVRRLIAGRAERLKESFGPPGSEAGQFSPEDLAYDEF